MRKPILLLIPIYLATAIVAGAVDYDESYEFIIDSGITEEFGLLAVKSNRPMPWAVFADNTYKSLKGKGKASDSDWFEDKEATVWLIILDDEFRADAKLFYLDEEMTKDDKLTGWFSLTELETNIYPVVMEAAMASSGHDEEAMQRLEEIIAHGAIVNNLQLAYLLVVPDEKGGPEWKSAFDAGGPYSEDAGKMLTAYEAGDKDGLHDAAESLAANLEKAPVRHPVGLIKLEKITHAIKPFQIAFWIYLAASLILFAWLIIRKKAVVNVAVGIVIAGIAIHAFAIVARSFISGYFPTTNMYEYLAVFSWASALSFVVFYFVTRQAFIGVIVMPVAFLLIVLASLFPSHIDNQLVPALQSYWLVIHVSLAALAEGAFAVAFGAGVLYLLRPLFGPEREDSFVPSRKKLDRIGYAAVSVGYPMFLIGGLIAGAIWAQIAWSVWWSWDPKEVASLIVFIIATLYLHARHTRGWKGTRTAVIQIIIFIAALLTLFSNLVLGGLHSYV
ncbi:MAG: cytochrome c biogenesis protein CcsA [bacterium]|nr:cytochrome c biogenesis protein CcsA [bacterium]